MYYTSNTLNGVLLHYMYCICRMFLKMPFLQHARAQDVDIQIVSYVYKIVEEHLKGKVLWEEYFFQGHKNQTIFV